MMVRRSSCGLVGCWILAWTSSLVTWSFFTRCIVSCCSTSFHNLFPSSFLYLESQYFIHPKYQCVLVELEVIFVHTSNKSLPRKQLHAPTLTRHLNPSVLLLKKKKKFKHTHTYMYMCISTTGLHTVLCCKIIPFEGSRAGSKFYH